MAERASPARRGRKSSGAAVSPKRAKKTLGDDFLNAVRADFRAHGAGVIAAVRADKPDQYLKIVQSVLPKELAGDINGSIDNLESLSDDEIRRRIRSLETVLGPFRDQPEGSADVGAQDLSGAAAGTGPQAPG
jgi:hypothetical protein